MSERISNRIVLVEDQMQQTFVRAYLKRCGHDPRGVRFRPLCRSTTGGSGEKYVRDQFPLQVQECRGKIGKRMRALLITMIDADTLTVKKRRSQLIDTLRSSKVPAVRNDEAVVVLIPKRHIETWVWSLVGERVDEATDYKRSSSRRSRVKQHVPAAVERLYLRTRDNAEPLAKEPRSLTTSIPEWRKIPSRTAG